MAPTWLWERLGHHPRSRLPPVRATGRFLRATASLSRAQQVHRRRGPRLRGPPLRVMERRRLNPSRARPRRILLRRISRWHCLRRSSPTRRPRCSPRPSPWISRPRCRPEFRPGRRWDTDRGRLRLTRARHTVRTRRPRRRTGRRCMRRRRRLRGSAVCSRLSLSFCRSSSFWALVAWPPGTSYCAVRSPWPRRT